MVDLEWDKAYEIGVDFIDAEHQGLLATMRAMRDAIIRGDLGECSDLSLELISGAEKHFRDEERYLEKVRYPGLREHKEYHRGLVAQALLVKQICEGTEQEHDLEACFEAMEQFMIDDIINGDLQFVSFLEYEGHLKRKFL